MSVAGGRRDLILDLTTRVHLVRGTDSF